MKRDLPMKRRKQDEAGTILIAFTLFLVVLLGFCALGMEAGRWFMVRAELSKSVDAAALVAAKNLSNPFLPQPNGVENLAREFAAANFPSGYLGTPGAGKAGAVTFNATVIGNDKVEVDGSVSATAILSRLFGVNLVPTASSGVAQKKEVEIMLVLDRSGSMGDYNNAPINALKLAAVQFVTLFASTQDKDKMGLITYSTPVTVVSPLGINYVTPMVTAINAMSAGGHTNAEDAIDQADGPSGFTDQTSVPGDRRIQQFLIFFSDGRPNTIRSSFMSQGVNYDANAFVNGNCDPGDYNTTNDYLYRPNAAGESQLAGNVRARPTGNGTSSLRCPGSPTTYPSARWYIFDSSPVPGFAATANCIQDPLLGNQVCKLAADLAVFHAGELKARHVTVYSIGLGPHVNTTFMQQVASGPGFYYNAPAYSDLQAIFQRVAQEIKLRLVQ